MSMGNRGSETSNLYNFLGLQSGRNGLRQTSKASPRPSSSYRVVEHWRLWEALGEVFTGLGTLTGGDLDRPFGQRRFGRTVGRRFGRTVGR